MLAIIENLSFLEQLLSSTGDVLTNSVSIFGPFFGSIIGVVSILFMLIITVGVVGVVFLTPVFMMTDAYYSIRYSRYRKYYRLGDFDIFIKNRMKEKADVKKMKEQIERGSTADLYALYDELVNEQKVPEAADNNPAPVDNNAPKDCTKIDVSIEIDETFDSIDDYKKHLEDVDDAEYCRSHARNCGGGVYYMSSGGGGG